LKGDQDFPIGPLNRLQQQAFEVITVAERQSIGLLMADSLR